MVNFFNQNFCIFIKISLKVVSEVSIDKKNIIGLNNGLQTDEKSLSEPMMA